MNYILTAKCKNSHRQDVVFDSSLGADFVKGVAGLLDGSSKFYQRDPRLDPESPLGKCGICRALMECTVQVDMRRAGAPALVSCPFCDSGSTRVKLTDGSFGHEFTNPEKRLAWCEPCTRPLTINEARDQIGAVGPDVSERTGRDLAIAETWEDKPKATLSGNPPAPGLENAGAPQPKNPDTGMYGDYYVLPEEERKKGFVRPYRDAYRHIPCDSITKMGRALSETYARDPKFYGSTFCCACREHFPVSQFIWKADGQPVGS